VTDNLIKAPISLQEAVALCVTRMRHIERFLL
jgi:hypothetical protein